MRSRFPCAHAAYAQFRAQRADGKPYTDPDAMLAFLAQWGVTPAGREIMHGPHIAKYWDEIEHKLSSMATKAGA